MVVVRHGGVVVVVELVNCVQVGGNPRQKLVVQCIGIRLGQGWSKVFMVDGFL